MQLIINMLTESWHLLLESSIYILFGIVTAGLLRVFLNPGFVARHLGEGKAGPVFKASLLGIPIPLCSCGVLPAAAGLKKQGAGNGAVTSFLISTPESGVDSMAITWALLDPIMTVARPVTAFFTAVAAGLTESFLGGSKGERTAPPDLSCPVDGCCDGVDCDPQTHRNHHSLGEKLAAGFRFAFTSVWGDIASWFFVGLLLAGIITVLIPEELISRYLGGGLTSMLLMLAIGIPIYICATASTPVAAALILKGVSPGAALVFLIAGPATNITSLTVLTGVLGKRATAIYLACIALFALIFGLLLDAVYFGLGISAVAVAGTAAEIVPHWLQLGGAIFLLLLSIKPVLASLRALFGISHHHHGDTDCGCCDDHEATALKTMPGNAGSCSTGDCGCSGK